MWDMKATMGNEIFREIKAMCLLTGKIHSVLKSPLCTLWWGFFVFFLKHELITDTSQEEEDLF